MNAAIEEGRWAVGPDDFATRIILPDLKGFFEKLPIIGALPKSRTLIIEPGTRALVIDDGLLIGQITAGTYTLESFLQRLQFWRNKQATIFLTRAEDLPIESESRGTPCADNICFDLTYRWTVQISDILPFMNNLMGARNTLPIPELEGLLTPIVQQAVFGAVGVSTYDQVRKPDFVSSLQQNVKSQIDIKLARYGLAFIDIQNVRLKSDAEGIENRKSELFQKSRLQQFEQAVKQLENDGLKNRLADFSTKTEVRDQLRRVVADDKFNSIASRNDFEKAVLAIDKEKLLRVEEHEALLAAFEDRKEDREGQRAHLLASLDLQRERELDEMRMEMDHAMRQKGLAREIELANLSRGEEAQQWRHELSREKERMEHGLERKQKALQAKWERISLARGQSRADAWESLLHDQKMEEIRADVEAAKAERGRRVAIIQAELESRLAHEKLEIRKREQEWELENRDKRSDSQLARLQKMQEMNAQFAERQARMQVEMENLKQDSASKREIDRIQAMSNVSSEVLIATANQANAALLADLKKSEAGNADRVKLDEERQRLYDKLNESERAKADAIAEAYKMALQAQQSNVQQMIGGLSQASVASNLNHPHTPPAAPPFAPPPVPPAATWYVSFNGQQSPPLQWAQILQYIQMGQLTRATMVWKAGMSSWAPAGQVAELMPFWSSAITSPPPMTGGGPPPM